VARITIGQLTPQLDIHVGFWQPELGVLFVPQTAQACRVQNARKLGQFTLEMGNALKN